MSLVWLVCASLVWTGLIAVMAEWLSRAAVRPHFAQGVWRGSAFLMALPWLAAGLVAIWPTGTDMPLPPMTALPAAAGAAVTAIGGAEAALKDSAAPWVSRVLLAALVAGWAVRLLSATWSQVRLQRLKAAATPGGTADQAAAKAWASGLGLTRTPDVRNTQGGSPFVAGLGQRTIYLPACIKDDQVRRLVIAHECVHLKRGDLVSRPFERAIADLIWFSPFAWLARRRLDYLREVVCDAETVALTGSRTEYARALTGVARAVRPGAALPVSGFIPRRKHALGGRVAKIVNTGDAPPNRAAAIAATALALAAAPLAIAQGIALEARASVIEFTHPVVTHERAWVSSPYGFRAWRGEAKLHKGADIAAPKGTPVFAPTRGIVKEVATEADNTGLGNTVVLYLEDGRKLRFGSLDAVKAEEGQTLWPGDVIGTVGTSAAGATGRHVHVELWQKADENRMEPIDPESGGVVLCDDKPNA